MSTKEKVMEELLNSDDYISGETLAQKLGVGRNSVWKAVKQLQENGERKRLKKYPGLKVGDLKEANNNVGNWE